MHVGGLEQGPDLEGSPPQLPPVLRVRAGLSQQVPHARHRLWRPLLEPKKEAVFWQYAKTVPRMQGRADCSPVTAGCPW